MKPILKEDISAMSDIIVELPPFQDLKSKDLIKEVFEEFLNDLYIEQLQELFDIYDNKLSDRLQKTFFANYGIDEKYSNKIKGYFKKNIAFNLEKLFQNKGSKIIFELFAHILENIFRKINFYNVVVYKIPTEDSFHFEYRLEPLYIQDEANKIIYPIVPIKKTRKYLMDLENFKNFTVWPVSTNLIYIQFSNGEEAINNMKIFLNGIRSYAVTYLNKEDKILKYRTRFGSYDTIFLKDIEFLVNFLQIELIRRSHDTDFIFPDDIGTYLPFDPDDPQIAQTREEFLCLMQDLIFDYQDADYRKRQQTEDLKRRWQFFLKLHEKNIQDWYCHFSSYQEMLTYMENKYPNLLEEIQFYMQQQDLTDFYEFQFNLYIQILGAIYATQDPSEHNCSQNQQHPEREQYQLQWILDYADAVFNVLFVKQDFLNQYFNPIMDLFIRYFFPVEMEYINDLIQKIIIKDKWNSVGTEEKITRMLTANRTSLQTPIRGLDKKLFRVQMKNVHSYIDKIDLPRTLTQFYKMEDQQVKDHHRLFMPFYLQEIISIEDYQRIKKFTVTTTTSPDSKLGVVFTTNINLCFKVNRTKDYQVAVNLKKLTQPLINLIQKEKNVRER